MKNTKKNHQGNQTEQLSRNVLHQVTGGALNFDLTSLNNFDQLTVTHNVTLGGELDIWNHGYTPVWGDSFVVATFDQRLASSTFSSVNPHGFGSGVSFNVAYHEHDVTVTVVPEPEQYLMLLAGLGLVGGRHGSPAADIISGRSHLACLDA